MEKNELKGILKYTVTPSSISCGEPQDVEITVTSHDKAKPCKCEEIYIDFTYGENAEDLFAGSPSPTCTVDNKAWVISKVKKDLKNENTAFSISFKCSVDVAKTLTYDLKLSLSGQVNNNVGNAKITFSETSAEHGSNKYEERTYVHTESKGTEEFYLKNFIATSPESPARPKLAYKNGDPINLSWASNGTHYEVYQDDNKTPIYSGSATFCKLEKGLTDTSVFVLDASKTRNTKSNAEGEHLYANLTIKITDSLYLANFFAASPETPNTPKFNYLADKKVQISWKSNGTNFQLWHNDVEVPDVTSSTYTFAGGFKDSSILFLKASKGGTTLSSTIPIKITNPPSGRIGEIVAFACSKNLPENTLPCDGCLVKISEYPELFAVIGTTWGGDITHFNLPDGRAGVLKGVGESTKYKDEHYDCNEKREPVGTYQQTAIRDIKGSFYAYSVNRDLFSGSFYRRDWGPWASNITSRKEHNVNGEQTVAFAASKVVPTGNTNRDNNLAVQWVIYYR